MRLLPTQAEAEQPAYKEPIAKRHIREEAASGVSLPELSQDIDSEGQGNKEVAVEQSLPGGCKEARGQGHKRLLPSSPVKRLQGETTGVQGHKEVATERPPPRGCKAIAGQGKGQGRKEVAVIVTIRRLQGHGHQRPKQLPQHNRNVLLHSEAQRDDPRP